MASSERRQQLDHERYLRDRETRLLRQKDYYQKHREELKRKRQERIMREWEKYYNQKREHG